MGKYRFCAQVHYIFGCAPGEQVHQLLFDLGLLDAVRFNSLDPEGYDHVVIGNDRYQIPLGWDRFRDKMIRDFPEATKPLLAYFKVIAAIDEELDRLPKKPTFTDLLAAPFRFSNLLRYKNFTLTHLYDQVGMPKRLRAILAGQCGDYLLPPSQVSLLIHTELVMGYGRGSYYPEKHYSHFIESIVDTIRNTPGCKVLLENEVKKIETEKGKVTGVVTQDGTVYKAGRFISNVDPAKTLDLMEGTKFSSKFLKKLDYDYSYGTVTLYLGIKNIDLRDHGFGSFNIWHYPHEDLDKIYADQGVRNDLSDPWLFLSTPSLHSSEPGLCPPGCHVLEVATHCKYEDFKSLREADHSKYNVEKRKVRDRILDILEARYIPNLRKNLDLCVVGTPATNERYCFAPYGNSYGAALTPGQVTSERAPFQSPIDNLWFVNATAGFPSIGGTVSSGRKLYQTLSS
jgi:phytoene dehydrogenase-like protein